MLEAVPKKSKKHHTSHNYLAKGRGKDEKNETFSHKLEKAVSKVLISLEAVLQKSKKHRTVERPFPNWASKVVVSLELPPKSRKNIAPYRRVSEKLPQKKWFRRGCPQKVEKTSCNMAPGADKRSKTSNHWVENGQMLE